MSHDSEQCGPNSQRFAKRQFEGVERVARDEKLKLADVLKEIKMSRAAFYRMRARGKAPKLIKLPNGHLRVRRSDLDAWWRDLDSPAY